MTLQVVSNPFLRVCCLIYKGFDNNKNLQSPVKGRNVWILRSRKLQKDIGGDGLIYWKIRVMLIRVIEYRVVCYGQQLLKLLVKEWDRKFRGSIVIRRRRLWGY